MRRSRKFVIYYFLFFGALSVIAVIPGGALFALLLTIPLLSMPGLLVIASPTILLYSASLVPLWLALTAPQRRYWLIAVTALIPVVVAVGPGLVSLKQAGAFGIRMSRGDFSKPASVHPKSVELIGDGVSGLFVYAQEFGDKHASCNEICRRLLFNGEAEWVRMTRIPDPYLNRRSGATWSVTYHIEHHDSCPQVYPDGTAIEKAVRDRLVAGDCLIATAGGDAAPDVSIKFITPYYNQHYPPKPPAQGPDAAIIETVKELQVAERRNGALMPIIQQTETSALTTTLPFYVGAEMHMQGGYNGATIGREKTVMKAVDLAQVMRDTFGYKLAAIAPPPPEEPAKIADRILSLPSSETLSLSAQQQSALNEQLVAMRSRPALTDGDLAFLRRVISDPRINNAQLGGNLQLLFGKFTAQLTPFIPVILERMKIPVAENVGHYQGALGWSLANFPAEALAPYRAEIFAILEAQAEWPTTGLLTRVAEIGGEPADLISRRLDSKSGTVRQFAAVAACRANADTWPSVEPVVLAHLPQRQGYQLADDEQKLMLALIRFGKKPLVQDMIDRHGIFNKPRLDQRLAAFDAGFDPKRCRDYL